MNPYLFGDTPQNRQRCIEILERAGGYNGLSANEAYEIGLHCPDLLQGVVSGGLSGYEPVYASPIDYGGGGGAYADPVAEPPIQFQEPMWAAPEEPVLTDPYSYAPTTNGGGGALAALLGLGTSIVNALGAPTASMAPSALQGTLESFGQGGLVQATPITANVAANCWTDHVNNPAKQARAFLRRRVRFVRRPDGGIQMIQSCAPRRMNPLNPRALARAGRRVGRFCAIASGMQSMLQKVVNKGCKTRRRAPSFGGRACGPKRCR